MNIYTGSSTGECVICQHGKCKRSHARPRENALRTIETTCPIALTSQMNFCTRFCMQYIFSIKYQRLSFPLVHLYAHFLVINPIGEIGPPCYEFTREGSRMRKEFALSQYELSFLERDIENSIDSLSLRRR